MKSELFTLTNQCDDDPVTIGGGALQLTLVDGQGTASSGGRVDLYCNCQN